MMAKENFFTAYKSIEKFLKECDNLLENPALNSDYISDCTGFGWEAIENSLKLSLDKDAIDWIYWWFFEKPYIKDEVKARNATGEVLPTETPEDLWNLIYL